MRPVEGKADEQTRRSKPRKNGKQRCSRQALRTAFFVRGNLWSGWARRERGYGDASRDACVVLFRSGLNFFLSPQKPVASRTEPAHFFRFSFVLSLSLSPSLSLYLKKRSFVHAILSYAFSSLASCTVHDGLPAKLITLSILCNFSFCILPQSTLQIPILSLSLHLSLQERPRKALANLYYVSDDMEMEEAQRVGGFEMLEPSFFVFAFFFFFFLLAATPPLHAGLRHLHPPELP